MNIFILTLCCLCSLIVAETGSGYETEIPSPGGFKFPVLEPHTEESINVTPKKLGYKYEISSVENNGLRQRLSNVEENVDATITENVPQKNTFNPSNIPVDYNKPKSNNVEIGSTDNIPRKSFITQHVEISSTENGIRLSSQNNRNIELPSTENIAQRTGFRPIIKSALRPTIHSVETNRPVESSSSEPATKRGNPRQRTNHVEKPLPEHHVSPKLGNRQRAASVQKTAEVVVTPPSRRNYRNKPAVKLETEDKFATTPAQIKKALQRQRPIPKRPTAGILYAASSLDQPTETATSLKLVKEQITAGYQYRPSVEKTSLKPAASEGYTYKVEAPVSSTAATKTPGYTYKQTERSTTDSVKPQILTSVKPPGYSYKQPERVSTESVKGYSYSKNQTPLPPQQLTASAKKILRGRGGYKYKIQEPVQTPQGGGYDYKKALRKQ